MDVCLESLFPPPVLHPGVVLRLKFLDPYGIPQGELAQAIGIERTNLCTVIHGRRPVTLELGRLLAGALGTLPEYWLLRQLAWDLEHAQPLRPVVRMPQLLNHTDTGARLRRRLEPSSWFNLPKRQPLRGSSGSKSSPDRPF